MPAEQNPKSPPSASIGPRDSYLPDPKILAAYNEIDPTFAARILAAFEETLAHRREMDRFDFKRSNWGLIGGWTLAAGALVGAVALGICGHEWASSIIGGLDIGAIVAGFVVGSNNRK